MDEVVLQKAEGFVADATMGCLTNVLKNWQLKTMNNNKSNKQM